MLAHRLRRIGNDRVPFLTAIYRLGLAGNLRLCLDAGDALSYTSGQSWLDRSGNGYDFFLGTTSGADATDPTFTGAAGGLSSSEYWSFDGGDFFRYDTTTESWMNNIHKDNAIYTFIFWVRMDDTATTVNGLCGTRAGSNANVGFNFYVNTNNTIQQVVSNGSAQVMSAVTSGLTVTDGAWHMISITLNEATGASGCSIGLNSSFEAFTSTYTSPSSSDAGQPFDIAARGNGNTPLHNASRLAGAMMWEGTALTTAQITSFFEATRARFGV